MPAKLGLQGTFRSRSSSIERILAEVRNAFDPNSRGIQVWHQLLLLCLIYEVMILPYIAAFEPRGHEARWLVPELGVIYVCELLFLADVYVELNTGYYEDGNVTLDVKKSRVKYLTSKRFLLDIIALPPLSLLQLAVPDFRFSPVFLEFHKFARVWRLPKYVVMLDDIYARHYVVLKMFKVLLVTTMLCHYVACFRFLFGYDVHHNNHWLPHLPSGDQGGRQPHSQYLMSLFWAFGLLTGLFEGELPTTIVEFVFTIFVQLCGFSLFTYLLATFFMISKCESGHVETAEARINQLKHLLSFHRVPESLQRQAIEYLTRYYTHSESNDREAMRLLCPSISKDIQVEMLKDMVGSIFFFRDCDHQFIIAVTSLLELISLPANVVVFNMGDEGDAMYVVNSGVLHVLVEGIKIREVRKGAFFGEMALFLNRPRYATVVTSTYCTLYGLVRFHIERLFEGYPEYATSIPKRVEEMARVLFGRASGEALIIPDASLMRGSDPKPEEKKKFADMIRKHIKKDKTKVAPSPSAAEVRGNGPAQADVTLDGSSHSAALKLMIAADTMRKSKPGSGATEQQQSKSDQGSSSHEREQGKSRSDSVHASRHTAAVDRANSDIRLSATNIVTSAHSEIYSQVGWTASGVKKRYWWSAALLSTAIESESRKRMWWIGILQAILVYNWFMIPLQLAFQTLRRSTWYVVALNVITDLVLWVDIYGSMNLSYVENSEKIWDTTRTAIRYFKGWFVFDFLCVFPYWFVAMTAHHSLPRIPRLFQIIRVSGHFKEFDDFVKLTSRQRLLLFGVLLLVLYHIVACLHFSITSLEGFSSAIEAWIPSNDIELVRVNASHFLDKSDKLYSIDDRFVRRLGVMQYFRSLYYAANVLTALGLTIEPASDAQYGFALMFMLSGFFITAIVVDNVQKRFTASAFEQKEFFATRSRIQIFLRRQNTPLAIHKRVNAFLDYWWSSHRGAVINELLEELPEKIKRDILQSICQPALQTLALLHGVRPVLTELETVFLNNVSFVLYGQGEIVYRQGDYASGLFFLLVGEVCIISNGGAPRSIHQGGFFGTAALQPDGNAVSYTELVTATSGCIVLFVSREHIQAMKRTFDALEDSLKALERRLLDPKLSKASTLRTGGGGASSRRSRGRFQALVHAACGDDVAVIDPDSVYMLAWETWLFLAMSLEWFFIMFFICFGVSEERIVAADAMIVVIEVHFAIDMFIRIRLGYYEFGNKIMVPKLIRAKYFRSQDFVVDLVALLPLYMTNWGYTPSGRAELYNINKLFRLIKVPLQFQALENKYLKRTLELRLFKLVYYTFLFSHVCGCIWFDFASNASGFHSLEGIFDSNSTEAPSTFGSDRWMPPKSLEGESLALQYFSSLFWSFGLESASNTGNLPKTIPQSIFTVLTMTGGFFCLAYVIGNLSDTNELLDAENREFYAKLNSLRHLISHFELPPQIADKFKKYFFFKHFHSITQEYLLEQCLPPSLLTDIRMVHLQPMIMKVNFLIGMDASVTRMLVSQFSQLLIVKDEFVYKYGEEGSDMFFVFTGVLCKLIPQEDFARDASVIERKAPTQLMPGHVDHEEDGQPPNPGIIHNLSSIAPAVRLVPSELTKMNEITAGSYFGENALFFNGVRSSYVQATTSCILYRLSRDSLELVFERYPAWKETVLRIITIHQEQQRLNRLAYEEEQNAVIRGMVAQGDQFLGFRRSRSRQKQSQNNTRNLASTGAEKTYEASATVCGLSHVPQWIIELGVGTKAQSWYHLLWLKLTTVATIYVSLVVPYRIAYDSLLRSQPLAIICRELELVCEFVFVWDIWFNWRLRGSQDSMELYEQDHRDAYKKERLAWDLVAAFPLDYILSSLSPSPWYRMNRCLKMRNLMHYLNEINRRSITNEMHRLRSTCLVYILTIYWSACMYFVVAVSDGYGDVWNAWQPSSSLKITELDDPPPKQITLRVLRGLFFATTAFVKKGKTFFPETTFHLVFAVVTCFVGLLVMAFMLGEIASLFISYISNEVEYRKNHIAVELYLGRWKIQGDLKNRTQAFLSSLWSSHRGVDYQALLEEVPTSVRTESVLNIAQRPLRGFTDSIFRPICRAADGESQQANIELLTSTLAQHLKFEGYPHGERVIVEGNISKAMYFVVRGYLLSSSRSHPTLYTNLSFVRGDYFGESGLLGYSVSAFSVSTMRACDLLSLSAEGLLDVLHSHPTFSVALKIADVAALEMKQIPLAGNSRTMEMRWGHTLMSVVNSERRTCDQSCSDRAERRALRKTRAILNRSFVTHSTEELYGSFRVLLQIIVPNGFTNLHGAARGTEGSNENGGASRPSDGFKAPTPELLVRSPDGQLVRSPSTGPQVSALSERTASQTSRVNLVHLANNSERYDVTVPALEHRETIDPTQPSFVSPRATPTSRSRSPSRELQHRRSIA